MIIIKLTFDERPLKNSTARQLNCTVKIATFRQNSLILSLMKSKLLYVKHFNLENITDFDIRFFKI
jgi:hypothetical protein